MKKMMGMIALCILLLAACSKTSDPASGGTGTYPLTGEKASGSGAVDDRPVAVMINNHTKARPQSGLIQADIVFEMLAEGEVTRFLALYQSEKPKEVGPVRSAREYYFKLAKGYDALYVYHGAAKFIDKKIKQSGVDYLNGAQHDDDGKLFVRAADRVAPHNSYLQFGAVYEAARQAGYKTKSSRVSLPMLESDAKIQGEPAEKVNVHLSSNEAYDSEFRYNVKEGVYHRWSAGSETRDLDTDRPVAVSNVFVLETPHRVIDKAGRRDIDLKSGGTAYLFQKGKMQKLEWKNENGQIIPYKDGKRQGFLPGRTWISVVPDDPGLAQSVQAGNQ